MIGDQIDCEGKRLAVISLINNCEPLPTFLFLIPNPNLSLWKKFLIKDPEISTLVVPSAFSSKFDPKFSIH